MAANKTSLSAGSIIRSILLEDSDVTAITQNIFPIVTDKAELPYILYRRTSLAHNTTKAKQPGADTVQIEVLCFTSKYGVGIDLAEAVRAALDYSQGEEDGLVMRSCVLSDSEEAWQDDAYVQQLVFSVKI
jgi:hypothetical protein